MENIVRQEGHDGPGVAHLSFPDDEVKNLRAGI